MAAKKRLSGVPAKRAKKTKPAPKLAPKVEVEHGCAQACYSGGLGEPYYQPSIACLCGWFERDTSWEEVGRSFDVHLEATGSSMDGRGSG